MDFNIINKKTFQIFTRNLLNLNMKVLELKRAYKEHIKKGNNPNTFDYKEFISKYADQYTISILNRESLLHKSIKIYENSFRTRTEEMFKTILQEYDENTPPEAFAFTGYKLEEFVEFYNEILIENDGDISLNRLARNERFIDLL
jgi:hypothetical protein